MNIMNILLTPLAPAGAPGDITLGKLLAHLGIPRVPWIQMKIFRHHAEHRDKVVLQTFLGQSPAVCIFFAIAGAIAVGPCAIIASIELLTGNYLAGLAPAALAFGCFWLMVHAKEAMRARFEQWRIIPIFVHNDTFSCPNRKLALPEDLFQKLQQIRAADPSAEFTVEQYRANLICKVRRRDPKSGGVQEVHVLEIWQD